MAVVPAGEFLERKKCKDRGGTWYSEPVKMCVSEDEVQIEADSIKCECPGKYEAKGRACTCTLSKDGEKVGEIESNKVSLEETLRLKEV